MKLETLLTPVELEGLTPEKLAGTACVVFDILRATSTFVSALNAGAAAIIPVGGVVEALAEKSRKPDCLLAGERDGVRIHAGLTGGVEFDLGNSPREFQARLIRHRTIISTTTNGTRALRACTGAGAIMAGSFLNLAATGRHILQQEFTRVLMICAGTGNNAALEDTLAAGALADWLHRNNKKPVSDSDATQLSLHAYLHALPGFPSVFDGSQNARKLLSLPDLAADVAFCRQRDCFDLVAAADAEGILRRFPPEI